MYLLETECLNACLPLRKEQNQGIDTNNKVRDQWISELKHASEIIGPLKMQSEICDPHLDMKLFFGGLHI